MKDYELRISAGSGDPLMDTDSDLPHLGFPGSTAEITDLSHAQLERRIGLVDLGARLVAQRTKLGIATLLSGIAAFGIASCLTPVFTAKTTFLHPQGRTSLGSTMTSPEALTGLKTGAMGNRMSTLAGLQGSDVELLKSATVSDRIIEHFDLMKVYGVSYRSQARTELANNVRIDLGKKDGILSVEVNDIDRQRAADIANRYVDEMRRLTDEIVNNEARQRRQLFAAQLNQTREKLHFVQESLQASGFNEQSMRTEPKKTSDSYAALRDQMEVAEVRSQVLKQSMNDDAAEVQRQLAQLSELRQQLARFEATTASGVPTEYVRQSHEFKYLMTLFDIYARQFEAARMDEQRTGVLVQTIDRAATVEIKSRPRRGLIALSAALLGFCVSCAFIISCQNGRPARTGAAAPSLASR